MSIASTQRVTVSVTECMTILEEWPLALPVVAELESARRRLANGTPVDRLIRERRDNLKNAVSSVLTAQLPKVGIPVTVPVTAPLERQVEAAVARFESVTRHTIQRAVTDALRSPQIGFLTDGPVLDGEVIEARRGHSVVRVFVRPDLTIERDWALGPGDACVPLDAELTAQLAARGILTTSVWTDRHGGRRDGAHLIAQAETTDPLKADTSKRRRKPRQTSRVSRRSAQATRGAR